MVSHVRPPKRPWLWPLSDLITHIPNQSVYPHLVTHGSHMAVQCRAVVPAWQWSPNQWSQQGSGPPTSGPSSAVVPVRQWSQQCSGPPTSGPSRAVVPQPVVPAWQWSPNQWSQQCSGPSKAVVPAVQWSPDQWSQQGSGPPTSGPSMAVVPQPVVPVVPAWQWLVLVRNGHCTMSQH